jgi:hypothetical protein
VSDIEAGVAAVTWEVTDATGNVTVAPDKSIVLPSRAVASVPDEILVADVVSVVADAARPLILLVVIAAPLLM